MKTKITNLKTMPECEPEMGFSFLSVYPTVVIGKRFTIGNFTTIQDCVVIGDDVVIGNNVIIFPSVKIGSGSQISDGCLISKSCEIGSNVCLGVGVTIVDDRSMCYKRKDRWGEMPIKIGDSTRIGARSVILSNVVIGRNALIHPCSVVLQNVDENEIVSGNPARVIGTVVKQNRI